MKGKSNLIKGAGLYILTSILNASIPLVLLPILTRYLSPSAYGEVALFTIWVSIASSLCGLTVHGAANRKYFDFKNSSKEMGEYIFSCIIILCCSSLILLLIVYLFSGFLSYTFQFPRQWLLLGILVAAATFFIQIRLGQWRVREKPINFGIFQISQSIVNMSMSIVLVVPLALGAAGRIGGYAASIVLFAIISVLLLKRNGLLVCSWRLDFIKDALRFGVPLVPHTVGTFLLLSIDRAVISSLLGVDNAGIYMVAAQIASVSALILDAINKAFSPWVYRNLSSLNNERARHMVVATYYLYGMIAVGVALGFLIGDDLLIMIAGEEFHEAANIVGWIILGQGFRGCYIFLTSYIFYQRRTGLISLVTLVFGIFNVFLLFAFINVFGLVGAAYALCVSMFLQWLVVWRLANNLIPMPWFSAFKN